MTKIIINERNKKNVFKISESIEIAKLSNKKIFFLSIVPTKPKKLSKYIIIIIRIRDQQQQ